jgi:hypothetical protein
LPHLCLAFQPLAFDLSELRVHLSESITTAVNILENLKLKCLLADDPVSIHVSLTDLCCARSTSHPASE